MPSRMVIINRISNSVRDGAEVCPTVAGVREVAATEPEVVAGAEGRTVDPFVEELKEE